MDKLCKPFRTLCSPHGRGKFLVTLDRRTYRRIRRHSLPMRKSIRGCVVQIDAHGDLRQAYQDNPYSHASVMARVVQDRLPLVQVGIRSISRRKSGSSTTRLGSRPFCRVDFGSIRAL